MICPACKNDMIVVEYQRIELDFCPDCRGVWFDKGELQLMLETARLEGKFLDEIQHLPETGTEEKLRKCPICRRAMVKNTIGAPSPVMIDVCRQGDGLFFDGGEIHQLVKQLPADKPGDANPVIGFIEEVFKAAD